jgi:hypothetical protein
MKCFARQFNGFLNRVPMVQFHSGAPKKALANNKLARAFAYKGLLMAKNKIYGRKS